MNLFKIAIQFLRRARLVCYAQDDPYALPDKKIEVVGRLTAEEAKSLYKKNYNDFERRSIIFVKRIVQHSFKTRLKSNERRREQPP